MLSIDNKVLYERSVLGMLLNKPSLGKSMSKQIKPSYFSSDYRRTLLLKIEKESDKGLEVVINNMTTTDQEKEELALCISLGMDPNFRTYLLMLEEDERLNKLYRAGQKIQDMVVNDSNIDSVISYIERKLRDIEPDELDEFVSSMSNTIKEIKSGEINYEEYHIDWGKWDSIVPITPQSIIVLAGNEGTFKTKFMLFISRKLLSNHSNIAIKWYSMEDPRDKLIRGFISQDTLLTDKELRQKDYIKFLNKDIAGFDIEFVNKSSTMQDIGKGFRKFRDKRKDKFCILIVDNIMKIVPSRRGMNENEIDSEIIRELDSWNIKTDNRKASVFLLHHFTKEAMSSKNQYKGFEPKIDFMRGGGKFKDTATHVLLVNPMYSHSEIVRLFGNKMIEKYYLMHVAKNRNGEKDTFRMFAYPAYNHFFLL